MVDIFRFLFFLFSFLSFFLSLFSFSFLLPMRLGLFVIFKLILNITLFMVKYGISGRFEEVSGMLEDWWRGVNSTGNLFSDLARKGV